jgi:hypothetical protein
VVSSHPGVRYSIFNSPRDSRGFRAPVNERLTLTKPDDSHLIEGPFFGSLDESAEAACAEGQRQLKPSR